MSATKAIAARVPMEDFLKFQKEAIELKMSMNDFLIMKLYANADKSSADRKPTKSSRLIGVCESVHHRLSMLHDTISGNNPEQRAYGKPKMEDVAEGVKSIINTLSDVIEIEK